MPGVRDVHPDRQLTRALTWEGDSPPSPDESCPAGQGSRRRLQTWEHDGDRIRKRPGRFARDPACQSCRKLGIWRLCLCSSPLATIRQHQAPAYGICVSMRSGVHTCEVRPLHGRRLQTRSTFGLHDDSNGSAPSLDPAELRRLLAANSVTSVSGAPELWAAGFKGQGVKMGVFDTGIRLDHPHVKNIKCAVSTLDGQAGQHVVRVEAQPVRLSAWHGGRRVRRVHRGATTAYQRGQGVSLDAQPAMWGRSGRIPLTCQNLGVVLQGAVQLDARADAGGWPGPRHLRGWRRGVHRRRLSGLRPGSGPVHISRLHQRPGGNSDSDSHGSTPSLVDRPHACFAPLSFDSS